MTDDLNTEVPPAVPVRSHGALGYAKGPLVAGSLVAALLIPVLILSGISATNAMATKGGATTTMQTAAAKIEAPPTPVPGDAAPGTDDPVTPPDRNSDQIGVPPQADEIYYIQNGDTLTDLSARFGMSIDYIADYNAVRDVNVISEGAALRVPFIFVPPAEGGLPG